MYLRHMKSVLGVVIAFALLAAPAQAHRLNWLAVRQVALATVQQSADEEPQAVDSGIASRCWRKSDHDLGCPVYLRINHIDEMGFVRKLRCIGLVEAMAHRYTTDVDWEFSYSSCTEFDPPPDPTPEQIRERFPLAPDAAGP